MKYLALIYADEGPWEAFSEAERAAAYEQYARFSEEAGRAGVLVDGAELASARNATTVRIRDGETAVTDGPYADTKEVLGGFFVLECGSMEEAVEWAAKIPGAEHGSVEVRPVHVDEEEGTAETAAEREGVAS